MAEVKLDNLGKLDRHCLPHMKPEHKRVLILKAATNDLAAIARHEHVSEGTVKHRLSIAHAQITMALDRPEELTAGLSNYWVARHFDGCLSDAANALRSITNTTAPLCVSKTVPPQG